MIADDHDRSGISESIWDVGWVERAQAGSTSVHDLKQEGTGDLVHEPGLAMSTKAFRTEGQQLGGTLPAHSERTALGRGIHPQQQSSGVLSIGRQALDGGKQIGVQPRCTLAGLLDIDAELRCKGVQVRSRHQVERTESDSHVA